MNFKRFISCLCASLMVGSIAGCQNFAPPTLEAQPEIEDPGNEIKYTISRTIGSNMVVQRNSYFNVFGWSENKGGIIYGEFMGEKRYCVIDDNGEWSIQFSSHEATTKPQTIKIYPLNGKTTKFNNVLVGDVWMVSGQSNAEMHLSETFPRYSEYKKEIGKNENIRLFAQTREYVVTTQSEKDYSVPQKDIINDAWTWRKNEAEFANSFSAVGYYFANELSKKADIPLGMVMSAAGGAVLHELMPQELATECGFTSSPCGQVSLFYNTLMHPFTKNSITGMIFYQGESEANVGQYKNYAQNLEKTVAAYREIWGVNFPFINIQLATHLGDSLTAWYELPNIRAAQFNAYRNIDNSYLVVSRDQAFQPGDPDWAHPFYKFEIGKRAADIAASSLYKVSSVDYNQSPEPVDIKEDGNDILVEFKHVGDGLKLLTGNQLKGFAAEDSEGRDILVNAEIINSKTVKLELSGKAKTVKYCMMPDGKISEANLGSSTDYPVPAFELSV